MTNRRDFLLSVAACLVVIAVAVLALSAALVMRGVW